MPPSPDSAIPQRFLKDLDAAATVEYDSTTRGWILSIGGAEQSHVDLEQPHRVFYEYLQRVANVVDVIKSPGVPVQALHLGGGAMTLPRYIAATRPGSGQVVVELARELPGFVTTHLPLPPEAHIQVVTGDARESLPCLGDLAAAPADVVVLDVFAGDSAPLHLRERSFYREIREVMAPHGVLLVNVGDDPGLAFFCEQARALSVAENVGSEPVFQEVWCLTEATMTTGRHAGNLILVASNHPLPTQWKDHLMAAGPHPAAVLDGWELSQWLIEHQK